MNEERKDLPGEEEQPKGLKEKIFSDGIMRYINIVFIIVLILQIPLLTVVGYAFWLVYLACGIVVRKDTSMRIAYGVLALFAVVIIILNIIQIV